ncbi:MAG: hypothetical protein ABSB01_27520 [Streptosporangiaceae bacterium]
MADDVILCASELATNATLHSRSGLQGGTFTVRASIDLGHSVQVEVEGVCANLVGSKISSPG